MCYLLLLRGVSPKHVRSTVADVLNIAGVRFGRLPGDKTCREFNIERLIIGEAQNARAIHAVGLAGGAVGAAGDAGSLFGHSAFGFAVHLPGKDGVGDLPQVRTLGLETIADGKSTTEVGVMLKVLRQTADSYNAYSAELKDQVAKGIDWKDVTKLDTPDVPAELSAELFQMDKDHLVRPFRPTMSDSAAGQQKTNKLFFQAIIDAHRANGADEKAIALIKTQLVQFFCWLHKVHLFAFNTY
jgi:hypothetical protein